eukprot:3817243-Prymnesium_polylepis.1
MPSAAYLCHVAPHAPIHIFLHRSHLCVLLALQHDARAHARVGRALFHEAPELARRDEPTSVLIKPFPHRLQLGLRKG